jgi:uncharacterized protein YkwD
MGLLVLHNDYRANHKPWSLFSKPKPLSNLTLDTKLMLYAMNHAEWMAKNDKLKHSSMSAIMKLGFNAVAENIAWGQETDEKVMAVWTSSRGHRNNILSPKFTKMGYASVPDMNGQLYWCVVFGS